MVKGYFLTVGDKTSCGGSIITGSQNHFFNGKTTARNGDKYICGKDKKEHTILGGYPNYIIENVAAAGTLHSKGSCACECTFIPSFYDFSYECESEAFPGVVGSTPPAAKSAPSLAQSPAVTSSVPVPGVIKEEEPRTPVDAGYCIVPWNGSPIAYEPYLFQNSSKEITNLYKRLNPEQRFKAGSILLVVDPLKQDSAQIEHMKKAKARIDKALEPLTEKEASFLYENRNVIDLFSSVGGDYGGLVSGMAKDYFQEIQNALVKIEETYRNQLITQGTLISEQFYIERDIQFRRLDSIFLKMFRNPIGLADYDDIRKALRLSGRSIMHRWNETGNLDIEGYATYIERSAKITKLMRTIGKVGIGLSALNGLNTIYEACTTGKDCEKTAYTEIGKFSAGIALSALFEGGVAAATSATCAVVLGAATAPVGGAGALACSIIVGAGYSFGVGKVSEEIGSLSGEAVYYLVK